MSTAVAGLLANFTDDCPEGLFLFAAAGYASRAEVAARILAKDPDPKSGQALVEASQDSRWLVRVAAVDSLARRGDPAVLGAIDPRLDDEKDIVKYTAAAAIIHLNGILAKKK